MSKFINCYAAAEVLQGAVYAVNHLHSMLKIIHKHGGEPSNLLGGLIEHTLLETSDKLQGMSDDQYFLNDEPNTIGKKLLNASSNLSTIMTYFNAINELAHVEKSSNLVAELSKSSYNLAENTCKIICGTARNYLEVNK